MLYRCLLCLLVLCTADAAIILESQFRYVDDIGTIYSTTEAGEWTAGRLGGIGVAQGSMISEAGFWGGLNGFIDLPPPLPSNLFGETKLRATFTLTQPQYFHITGAAVSGGGGGRANFILYGGNGIDTGVAVSSPSQFDSVDKLILLPAQRYTIDAIAEYFALLDEEHSVVGMASVWFSIEPLALVPEPPTALLLPAALALLAARRRLRHILRN